MYSKPAEGPGAGWTHGSCSCYRNDYWIMLMDSARPPTIAARATKSIDQMRNELVKPIDR